MTEIVYWQDDSSGRAHKRVRVGNSLQAFEADNLDQAGDGRVITAEELAALEPESLCHRCFPPAEDVEE